MAKRADKGGEGCPCCVGRLGGKKGAKKHRNRAQRREGRVVLSQDEGFLVFVPGDLSRDAVSEAGGDGQ